MARSGSQMSGLWRRHAAAIAVSVALLGMAAGATAGGRPHDTRMDDADAALEKAFVLVEASACATSGKDQRECERALAKTASAIAAARQHLADAMAAADANP